MFILDSLGLLFDDRFFIMDGFRRVVLVTLCLLCVVVVLVHISTSSSNKTPQNKTIALTRDNKLLHQKFFQFFSIYPNHFKDTSLPNLRKFAHKFKISKLIISTEKDFKELLKQTIHAGKILINNRTDMPEYLRLEKTLIFDLDDVATKKLIENIDQSYRAAIDFLIAKVKVPTKRLVTPYNFDWYHFSVTLPMLYSQAMVLYQNVYLAEEILGFLPKPHYSLGFFRTLSNVAQMGIPYIIAKCFLEMKNPLHNVNATLPIHSVHKVIPPNIIELFSPCGPNSTKDRLLECRPYTNKFIQTTDEYILQILVDFHYSTVFKENMELKIHQPILASSIKENVEGLDSEGGFIYHQNLRSYNYFLALLNCCIFYQIMYNAKTTEIQSNLKWIPKILHFSHRFVHPSIVSRYGSFTEFNNHVSAFIDIFKASDSLIPFMSDDMKQIETLYNEPRLQERGIHVFHRASFVSAIFEEWSIQMILPTPYLAYGEIDHINTRIVHQSAMSKIMLGPLMLENDNHFEPGDYGYPGTLWLSTSIHRPTSNMSNTLTLNYDSCTNNVWNCYMINGDILNKENSSHTEEGIFVSFARLKIKRFDLVYSELVIITKYGIIVGYLNIETIKKLKEAEFKCCIQRWPGIHSEYMTFNNYDNELHFEQELKASDYSETDIQPVNIHVNKNIIYSNVHNIKNNIAIIMKAEVVLPSTIPKIKLEIKFPSAPSIFKVQIDDTKVYVEDKLMT